MAVIHHTTLTPSKLELLSAWLPAQSWFQGGVPDLARCGGFRLDDPAGEVGLEFILVSDASGDVPATYHVPLAYRGSPLAEAGRALIGTSEHGVLGRRWIYDGTQDPVLTAQLLALLTGAAEPQDQDVSDTADPSVTVHLDGADLLSAAPPLSGSAAFSGTDLAAGAGLTVRIHRVLRPAAGDGCAAAGACGCVTARWRGPDGTGVRGPLFTVLR
jgi:Maltokinase N-terminal cap domain